MDTSKLQRPGKNDFLGICYTCDGHAETAARNHRPEEGFDFAWIVDEATPQILKHLPSDVSLWVLPFDRKKNLKGWECVTAMVAILTRAFALGYKSVCKRDSDTRILRYDLMLGCPEGRHAVFVNRCSLPRAQGWGAAYTIHAGALPLLQEAIELHEYIDAVVPEDMFFSWTLRRVSWMLPGTAGKFSRSPGYPEWEKGVAWENSGNTMPFPLKAEAYWKAWPDRTK